MGKPLCVHRSHADTNLSNTMQGLILKLSVYVLNCLRCHLESCRKQTELFSQHQKLRAGDTTRMECLCSATKAQFAAEFSISHVERKMGCAGSARILESYVRGLDEKGASSKRTWSDRLISSDD